MMIDGRESGHAIRCMQKTEYGHKPGCKLQPQDWEPLQLNLATRFNIALPKTFASFIFSTEQR